MQFPGILPASMLAAEILTPFCCWSRRSRIAAQALRTHAETRRGTDLFSGPGTRSGRSSPLYLPSASVPACCAHAFRFCMGRRSSSGGTGQPRRCQHLPAPAPALGLLSGLRSSSERGSQGQLQHPVVAPEGFNQRKLHLSLANSVVV